MTVFRLLVAGLLLAPLLSRPAGAQILDPSFISPTSLYAPGTVNALGPQQADGKRLVAGNFTRINGTAVSRLVRLDAAGALDLPFAQNVGTISYVYRIKTFPNGQYLLGSAGGTLMAGGLTRTDLLRLNANGTADASFDIGTGPRVASSFGSSRDYAVQPDGKVVAVGSFDTFNGQPAAGVVRLNTNGSVDPGFAVGTGLTVSNSNAQAVVVQPDGKILIGGSFTIFNTVPALGLVRLNANGGVDPTFTAPLQPGSQVRHLVLQPDGKVLVSGSLLTSTGPSTTVTTSLVRLLPSGSLDPGFSVTSSLTNLFSTNDAPVLLQPDGKLLVIGSFSTPSRVARLNADGSLDASFQVGVGPSDSPATIGLQANGSVLLGGSFNTFNGIETSLVQLTGTGAPDPAFGATLQLPGHVMALARQPDGQLVLGGTFTELNGQPVHQLLRLTTSGTLDAGFSTATGALPGAVTCLALQPDGKVLAGTTRGVHRFAANGSPDASFGLPGSYLSSLASISALALQPDGRVLISGNFNTTSGGGVRVNCLARVTTTGAFDPTFVVPTPSPSLGMAAIIDAVLVQPDGRIVVGGLFTPVNQGGVARVVRYETTGSFDPSFNNLSVFTNTNGTFVTTRIYALALQPDGKLLVGGNFGVVDGTPQYGVARLAPTGTLDPGFAPSAPLTGTVLALARQPNGRVLLGGFFTSTPAATLSNLARVLDNGQTDAAFGPTAAPSGVVRALLVQPDGAIVLAGNFTAVGGQPAVGVARLTAPNVLHVAAPAAVAARTAAWPVPAHGRLHVAPDLSARPRTVELLDALGRPVRHQPATNAAELMLDVEGLPAGVYLLRVHYAAGAVTRRVAVQ